MPTGWFTLAHWRLTLALHTIPPLGVGSGPGREVRIVTPGGRMLRRITGAMIVLIFCVGISLADEIRAIIIKVDGDKVTFAENKGKGEKGPEQTLTVSEKVKVVKGKFNKETKMLEAGDEIENGLKNEMFTKIGEKGVGALIITDDSKKITEIRVKGKKKNQ
jgi:hypothetical protein